MKYSSVVFRVLWIVLMVFVPTWLANILPTVTQTVWNPADIACLWLTSVPQLFEYSPAFCGGALFTLGLCLYWFLRYPTLLYAFLLFCASFMAGPTSSTLMRLWYYYAG